tara:strand:- start:4193 stop:4675 length:483 start_codon:yes stop_codon:yes gene_type:complete
MSNNEINNINDITSKNRELMSDILEKEPRIRNKFFNIIESVNKVYEEKLLPSILTYGVSGLAITSNIPEVVLNANAGISNYAVLGAGVAVAAFGFKKFGKVLDRDWDNHVKNADPSYREILESVEREFKKNKKKNSVSKKVKDVIKGIRNNQTKLGHKNA